MTISALGTYRKITLCVLSISMSDIHMVVRNMQGQIGNDNLRKKLPLQYVQGFYAILCCHNIYSIKSYILESKF